MILHFFPIEKFTENFVEFVNSHFDSKDHKFILYGTYDVDTSFVHRNNNVEVLEKTSLLKYYKYLYKSEAIIVHSLFFTKEIQILLSLYPKLKSKTAWVIWGGDLISLKSKSNIKIRHKLMNILKVKLIKRFKCIVTLVDQDWLNFKEKFNFDLPHFNAIYGNGRVYNFLRKIDSSPKNKDEYVNILVGNSATRSNNHIETLDLLKKFNNENIMIYLPLSYGDEEYKLEIIEYCEKNFKNKFKAIVDLMNYEDYLRFLSDMNIAIFNNDRQQALGNVRATIYFKCKIFLRADAELAKYYEDKIDFNILNDIKSMNFGDFINLNNHTLVDNKRYIVSELDGIKAKNDWEKIFAFLKKG